MSDQPDSALSRVPVVIAGGGPVGLSLAADLAWRRVGCLVVEPQREINPHPRAISIGVRTMEHFRRLGLDQAVIDAGVPRDRKLDVVYMTRLLGREIFRFAIPSIDDLAEPTAALMGAIPELAASPYYKTWTAQTPMERVLRRHVAASDRAGLRLGWRVASFEEGDDGVAVRLEGDDGAAETVMADFLVGCDGANSTVRAGLGIALSGKGTLGRARGIYFRAPGLDSRLPGEPGVMYWIMAPGCAGVIYTIDGGDEFVFNRYFAADEEPEAGDPIALLRSAIGEDVPLEILSVLDWLPRQLVADRYGSGRVFLAGDACHLFVPTGGFGMNTGIGDTVDLAWKIAAVRDGWGGTGLLASYEPERRPVGLRNTLEAADNYYRSGDAFDVPPAIEAEGAAGDAARAALAARLPPKIKHFAPIGVHLGYRYEGSPLIVPDGTPAPLEESATYTPTARPGHRAPHVWLAPGRSILDHFGRGFVLLRFGAAESSALEDAAGRAGVPLETVDIDNAEAARLYQRPLVLVRPDGHVAWRGDAVPADPGPIIDTIRGAA